MRFYDFAALGADQKLRACVAMVALTGDIGIEAFNAVNEFVFKQEFYCTVHRWRFWIVDIYGKLREDIIRA